jgi:ribosomal protein S18 acetylase RimI-like enzyme
MVEFEWWSPAEIEAARAELLALFAAAFAMPREEAALFIDSIAVHTRRAAFRFLAARDATTGQLLGFVYGYTSEPGQWYHDTVRAALGPALAARWLDGAFEFTEFAVLPEAQRRGIGTQLHDTILAGLPHRTAILSTYQGETAALRLYRRRGWRPLASDYVFPGGERVYVLMGLDLGARLRAGERASGSRD